MRKSLTPRYSALSPACMKSLTVFSPAKVNLFLKVLGKRKDGYHELVTLFHKISLDDKIIISKTSKPGFHFRSDHPKLKKAKDNLIYKAYVTLKKVVFWKGGVQVILKKRIPVAAGLGGGSSNAACFLMGMNRLFGFGLSRAKLVEIGSRLGADVPFFLYGTNQAFGLGKGERIKLWPCRKKYWFVLVVSPYEIPTAEVYKRLGVPELTRISPDATISSDFLRKAQGRYFLRNDLYLTACQMRPQLKQIDTLFDRLGVAQRLMSGSGPTFFSLHNSKKEAERIARKLRRTRIRAHVFVCRTFMRGRRENNGSENFSEGR